MCVVRQCMWCGNVCGCNQCACSDMLVFYIVLRGGAWSGVDDEIY